MMSAEHSQANREKEELQSCGAHCANMNRLAELRGHVRQLRLAEDEKHRLTMQAMDARSQDRAQGPYQACALLLHLCDKAQDARESIEYERNEQAWSARQNSGVLVLDSLCVLVASNKNSSSELSYVHVSCLELCCQGF